MKILITGGAGFIGSRLATKLYVQGHDITILDNLSEQIHGKSADFSPELKASARCIHGDVRDRTVLQSAVQSQEVIINFAAETGTGQSMYAVEHYGEVNLQATALLFDILVNCRPPTLRKLIVASSRAVYGEGQYLCSNHGTIYPTVRDAKRLEVGQFDPACPHCGEMMTVQPTVESAPFSPSSFYGLTKQVQEQMTLMFAAALGVDAFAMRYQNVYGPGQSLSNPYTGILAVFTNQVRQGKTLYIFEDGKESRDFVYIDDVVNATAACVSADVKGVMAVNVGSGVRTTVSDVASSIVRYFHAKTNIEITGAFRVGDIRHNVADLARLNNVIGYSPEWKFDDGLKQFLDWACEYEIKDIGYSKSLQELSDRGFMRRAS